MSKLLKGVGIGKRFVKGNDIIEVLNRLDLEVSQGERIAIVGASGVGKSTLLNILGGLDFPTEGSVEFNGESIYERSFKKLAEFRNRSIGFIFQSHHLLPEFSALENVMMPLLMRREQVTNAQTKAKEALSHVDLDHRLSHRPAELSGGEQQRVAIARALVGSPAMILADEPTGNLDVDTARVVGDLLFRVLKDEHRSMVVATHNPELASRADRLLRLINGHLVEAHL